MATKKISELPLYTESGISDGTQAFSPLDDLTVGTTDKTKRISFTEMGKWIAANLSKLVVNTGTLVTSTPLLLQQVWNAGAVVFTGVRVKITDTSSAAGSKPFEVLGGAAGATELLTLDKTGALNVAASLSVGGTAVAAFKTITVAGQSDVVADAIGDTLTIAAGANVTITTDAGTDTITIASTGGGGGSSSFTTVAVSGQSDIVADSSTDTLTIVAGNRIAITTNAGTDTLTIGLADGDYGDFTVSAGTATVDAGAISYAKIQDVSATDRILGRITAGAGDIEELTAAQVRTLINVADGAEVNQNAFTTVAVSGQSDVVAEAESDTLTLAAGNKLTITTTAATDTVTIGIADGDWGDFTVSGGTATIDSGAVTYAKIQDVSATDRLLGRATAGAGDIEEITCTAAGRALLDDADASAQRTTLGVLSFGTIAVSGQSDVVADAHADTLTLVAGSNITLTTNATTDEITIAATGGAGGNTFATIAVSGQSDVVADSTTDTLTLVEGSGIDITTNAGTDTITIASVPVAFTGLTVDSATPSVTGLSNVFTQNTVATDYSNFTGGTNGQILRIHIEDANSSFQNNATIALAGGVAIPASADPRTLVLQLRGTVWTQIGGVGFEHQFATAVDGSDNLTLSNSTSNAHIDIKSTGASSEIRLDVNGTDRLIASNTGVNVVGTLSVGGTAVSAFKTIVVSGQSDVVADSLTDTLTLIAGTNVTLTTNATNDEITIAASGGGGLPSGGSVGDLVVNTGPGTGSWSSVLSVGANGTTITGGTVTASTPVVAATQTWNSGAVTFDGIDLNVTNTASATGSRLINLRLGGTSQFQVTSSGAVRGVNGLASSPTYSFTGDTDTGMYYATNQVNFAVGGVLVFNAHANGAAVSGGTVVNPATPLTITQTWNDAADTFDAFDVNITNTNSAAASRLINLRVGGTSQFNVTRAGVVTTPGHYVSSLTGLVYAGQTSTRFGFADGNCVQYTGGDAACAVTVNQGLTMYNSYFIGIGSTTSPDQNPADTKWYRDGAGQFGQRNGTNAQSYRLYGTYTSSTNHERLNLYAQAADAFRIHTENGSGGGTARALELGTDETTRLTIGASGGLTIADANDLAVGTTTGTKIGTATTQKLGFWNATPVVQQVLATGSTTDQVITLLQTLGLCRQS